MISHMEIDHNIDMSQVTIIPMFQCLRRIKVFAMLVTTTVLSHNRICIIGPDVFHLLKILQQKQQIIFKKEKPNVAMGLF